MRSDYSLELSPVDGRLEIAPALAAGNTVVLKPASVTPLTAIILGQICREAGIPDGVMNVITGPGASIGDTLVTHPLVDKIAFTGETETGRQIMAKASRTIESVPRIGRQEPNIVFPDANLDEAINGSLFAIFTQMRASDAARARLFLHRDIYDEFISTYVDRTRQIRVGDPLQHETQMGPVISPQQPQQGARVLRNRRE